MEYVVLGDPADDATLRLDHQSFSYAGKFVMSNTGKVIAREEGDVVAALAFNEDRTDAETAWLRYVTVHEARRGNGIGPRLAAVATDYLTGCGYDRVRIAVNNPYAYQALFRAGYGYTGERTGLAELVLERPGDRSRERYRAGLDEFREREDLTADERSFLDAKADDAPPVSLPEPPQYSFD